MNSHSSLPSALPRAARPYALRVFFLFLGAAPRGPDATVDFQQQIRIPRFGRPQKGRPNFFGLVNTHGRSTDHDHRDATGRRRSAKSPPSRRRIRAQGLGVHISRGTERTLIGAIGDERKLDPEMFDTLPGVERSMHIVKPYKLVAREWHKANTVVDVRGIPIGGAAVQMIAGPCSVETEPQMTRRGRRRRGRRRAADARRRVQAAHQPLRVPGQGRRRARRC